MEEIYRELQVSRMSRHNLTQKSEGFPLSDVVILMLLYSMLYSVFDDQSGAVNLKELKPQSAEFQSELSTILQKWAVIEGPIRRIRHNFAFHGSASKAGTANAMKALEELGKTGSDTAYGLIEELRQIYPWLVVEAKGGFIVPSAHVTGFREVLSARQADQDALLAARRSWSVDSPREPLEFAIAQAEAVGHRWAAFCNALAASPITDKLPTFLAVWSSQIDGIRKAAETLDNLQRAVRHGDPRTQLRHYLTAFFSTLQFWKTRLQPDARDDEAFANVNDSVSRLVARLDDKGVQIAQNS
jgi:hypothetical protein